MLNINHNLHYSNDLSQIYFNDFTEQDNTQLIYRNGSLMTIIYYKDGEQKDAPHFKRYKLKRIRNDDLIEMCELYHGFSSQWQYYTKAELIEDLMLIDNEHYYLKEFDENGWDSDEYNYRVTGYSQGDVVMVVDLTKRHDANYDYISNILYDSPVSGSISIGGDQNAKG